MMTSGLGAADSANLNRRIRLADQFQGMVLAEAPRNSRVGMAAMTTPTAPRMTMPLRMAVLSNPLRKRERIGLMA